MTDGTGLVALIHAIADGELAVAAALVDAAPALVRARLARADEHLVEACRAQLYEGDTALHAAAFASDVATARLLVDAGADVRARNRRGAEPLHAAVGGGPGAAHWDPARQRAVIAYLVEAGADANAPAAGGVTALHRAVRNRCADAVEVLLRLGADPGLRTDRGTTALDLARRTTGRGGSGSAQARTEQRRIVALLSASP